MKSLYDRKNCVLMLSVVILLNRLSCRILSICLLGFTVVSKATEEHLLLDRNEGSVLVAEDERASW